MDTLARLLLRWPENDVFSCDLQVHMVHVDLGRESPGVVLCWLLVALHRTVCGLECQALDLRGLGLGEDFRIDNGLDEENHGPSETLNQVPALLNNIIAMGVVSLVMRF